MSVFALGLNHTTAPLDLRGRFAFSTEQLPAALQAFRSRHDRVSEVAIVSTCNRTELYVGAEATAVDPAVEWLAGVGGVPSQTLALACLRARRPVGGAPCISGCQRPRFDGARRAADPRPAEGGSARSRQRRHARDDLAADVPALVRRRQGSALVDRDRQPLDQHGGSGGAARLAAVRVAGPDPRSLRRRRRDDRAGGDAFRGARPAPDGDRQSQRRARRERWRRASGRRRCRSPSCRRGSPSSTSSFRARRARCPSSASARSSARCARAGIGRCSWSTWPCRATSSPRWRGCPTSTSIPSTTCRRWCRAPARNARPPSRRPR